MKTSWQSGTGTLECHWSEAVDPAQPHLPSLSETAREAREGGLLPRIPNFAAHSPLGSGEWFVPWSARWQVPHP